MSRSKVVSKMMAMTIDPPELSHLYASQGSGYHTDHAYSEWSGSLSREQLATAVRESASLDLESGE